MCLLRRSTGDGFSVRTRLWEITRSISVSLVHTRLACFRHTIELFGGLSVCLSVCLKVQGVVQKLSNTDKGRSENCGCEEPSRVISCSFYTKTNLIFVGGFQILWAKSTHWQLRTGISNTSLPLVCLCVRTNSILRSNNSKFKKWSICDSNQQLTAFMTCSLPTTLLSQFSYVWYLTNIDQMI